MYDTFDASTKQAPAASRELSQPHEHGNAPSQARTTCLHGCTLPRYFQLANHPEYTRVRLCAFCIASAQRRPPRQHFFECNIYISLVSVGSDGPFVFLYAYGRARIRVFKYDLGGNMVASCNSEGGACAAGVGGGACANAALWSDVFVDVHDEHFYAIMHYELEELSH